MPMIMDIIGVLFSSFIVMTAITMAAEVCRDDPNADVERLYISQAEKYPIDNRISF